MTPDLDRAAIKAAETLIAHRISSGPVDPFRILKRLPGVLIISYAEMAMQMDLDRDHLLKAISPKSYDAMSFAKEIHGNLMYFVIFNQRLPDYLVQRSIARELGHIILGHDGSRPEAVRVAEAQTFAYHLLCPRPLIRAVQDSGLRVTTEIIGNMTGCFERCLAGMRKTPGVHVPAELNRAVREQFNEYLASFIEYASIAAPFDESAVADFGTYMDNYEE